MKTCNVLIYLVLLPFVLTACDGGGNSPSEPEDPTGNPPDYVTNVRLATQAEGTSLRIMWDGASGVVDGYRVQGLPTPDPDSNTLGGIQCTYIDTTYGSVERTWYTIDTARYGCYTVTAFNEHGESENTVAFKRYDRTFVAHEHHDLHTESYIGWGPDTPPGTVFAGEDVDIYLTNLVEGYDTGPYYLAAPSISLLTPSDHLPWDPHLVEIQVGHYYAVHSHLNDHAVVYVESIDIAYGTVELRMWSPRVNGSTHVGLATAGL